MSTPVIEVKNLTVSYRRRDHALTAVRDLTFRVDRGEILAIVGESGSGKTTTAQTLLGLLPSNATIDTGAVLVSGQDLTRAKDKTWRLLRGRVVSLVPQDPMVGLNPTLRAGVQVGEAVRQATGLRGPVVDARVLELLALAGVPEPELRAKQYPHQLSGGLRQRALIAIALAGEPEVIVADEPTSALDVTVQKVILDHLESLVRKRGISLVIITHDLAVAADRADRVIVMQDGRLVEEGTATAVLSSPQEDYTKRLLDAAPALAAGGRIIARHSAVSEAPEILRLDGLSKVYQLPRTTAGPRTLTALDDVTLRVGRGQTLGIVGESGSGKTTALRLALGLERPTAGRIVFDGQDITDLSWRELRPLRRRFQLVQQNPYASIDPRFTVERAIVEPLVSFGVGSRADRRRRAVDLADRVALPQSSLDRPARELSGGQRQRVAIARALALEPDVIFLDEPVSALDVSVQAQILALLAHLQESLGLTYVFVSHDLSVVGELAHHVAVLASGRVVEYGVAEQVLTAPEHDLVRELIAAVPGVRT